ncbi:MAG: bifunctional precorrin-2 dehydrogenase/sirohydrochlorin ferrochelatase [Acidobacteria bacterium]|nr:bifunctional precorrin-2 dehydrogenase/sirohydrochlorin ferrochelatase [Acidobacteriota bacterium]
MNRLFPIFLRLAHRHCLVVGAGKVAEGKIAGLLTTGARVRVVAIRATSAVIEWARSGQVELILRPFMAADLDGVFLVIVATSSTSLNKLIYEEANRRGQLCNVVDVPELCDFYYPALVRRGDLQIAISTSGHSPALARRLREQLEKQFGAGYAPWVRELGVTRKLILASGLEAERKRELLLSLATRHAVEAALASARKAGKEQVA